MERTVKLRYGDETEVAIFRVKDRNTGFGAEEIHVFLLCLDKGTMHVEC